MNDITIRRPIQWSSAAATNVGTVRTINEDAILARPEAGMWIVADGMGGHEAGNVASKIVVDTFAEVEPNRNLNEFVAEIESRILDANQRLLEYSEIMLDGRIVGSTFVCLLVHGQVGVCMWAGDSRLYVYRGGELQQVSADHSHVAELLRQGVISEAEANAHPDANVITRAIGTTPDLYVDIEVFSIQAGDTYLLCSDGLYNTVGSQNIRSYLADKDLEVAVNKLIQDALDNGATDNVSAIVVRGRRGEEAA
jgi:serine/threonine protein phosphatase PrpC